MNHILVQFPEKICIECSHIFKCEKPSQYNKRKYCSRDCMYKNKEYISNRNSKAQGWKISDEVRKIISQKNSEKFAENRKSRFVKVRDGKELNVTVHFIDEYRKSNPFCEICGNKNILSGKEAKLCIDHDHKLIVFRGLLCQQCNRALGWYEKNSDKVEAYLKKNIPL